MNLDDQFEASALTVSDLCDAVRAELRDLLDDVAGAIVHDKASLFSSGGRSAMKRMQRVQALLKLIEKRSK